MLTPLLLLARLAIGAAPGFVVTPCVDEVTVRDAPGVAAKRLGAVPRGQPLEILRESPRERLTLTVDRNVPAPFKVSANDPWLEVRFGADGGVATGWVYAALLCRPSLAASAGRFTLLGWSTDETRLAWVETAPDAGACSPETFRIVDSSGQERFSLHDGCPAAALTLSRRRDLDAAMREHVIEPEWTPALRDTEGWTVSLERGPCADSRFTACPVVVHEPAGLRADVLLSLPKGAVDGEGFPRVELVGVLRRGRLEDAILRVAMSASTHRFEVVRLSDAPQADWRDFLPGVRLSGRPGPDSRCGARALEGQPADSAAEARLEAVNAELGRRLKTQYREAAFDACLLSAKVEKGRLQLELVPSACIGNECPGEVCRRVLSVSVGRDFDVGASRSRANEYYSCDP